MAALQPELRADGGDECNEELKEVRADLDVLR